MSGAVVEATTLPLSMNIDRTADYRGSEYVTCHEIHPIESS